jgi:phage internal scaffolding protein
MKDIAKEPVFIRTPYNYDTDFASEACGLKCEDETKTDQSFKEECDINTLINRFGLGMDMPTNFAIPQSGDFTEIVTDYQTAMNLLVEAQEEFMRLPAMVRDRFENNPAELIGFLENPDNAEEALKIGLLTKREEPAPMLVQVVNSTSDT